jgi:hypothetical protein
MTRYKRSDRTLTGRLQDEIIMMVMDQGKYFSLNPTATRIWDLLEQPMTHDGICEVLVSDYDVELDQCLAEVEEHLKEMVKLKLIVTESL